MRERETHGIFISYRREDSRADAGRLYDRLAARFGGDHVFMDIDDIEAGQKFVDVLHRTLRGCDVLIVLIGPGWLSARDESGASRLADERDFVRLEVQTALQRGITVIPVLVNRASMPARGGLPPVLEPLADRQAIGLTDSRFHQDVDELIEVLEGIATTDIRRRGSRARRLAALGVLAAIGALLGLGFWYRPWGPAQAGGPTAGGAESAGESAAGVVVLRGAPATLTVAQARAMLVQQNFFDAAWFPAGAGLDHLYEATVIAGDPLVVDRRTGLMWQQGGSGRQYPFDDVAAYVEDLNERAYGSYSDWRLPTLEEAMSLLTRSTEDDVHMSPLFSRSDAPILWTADGSGDGGRWVVYPYDGIARPEARGFNAWVRAVRAVR